MNLTGKYSSDSVIDYGKLIVANLQISIHSNLSEYQFKAGFYFADDMKYAVIEPIMGKDSGYWTNKDTEVKW